MTRASGYYWVVKGGVTVMMHYSELNGWNCGMKFIQDGDLDKIKEFKIKEVTAELNRTDKINNDKNLNHFFITEHQSRKPGAASAYHIQTTRNEGYFGRPDKKGGEAIYGKISFEGSYHDVIDFINNAKPI